MRTVMESIDSSLTLSLRKTIDLSRLNISGNNFKGSRYVTKSVDLTKKMGNEMLFKNH